MTPAIRVGTSGYNDPERRGSFYPERLPAGAMLPFYAERFATVEINATFYRMPTPKTVAGWADATPPGFMFTLKAPQRITHVRRLRNVDEPDAELAAWAAALARPGRGDVSATLRTRTPAPAPPSPPAGAR